MLRLLSYQVLTCTYKFHTLSLCAKAMLSFDLFETGASQESFRHLYKDTRKSRGVRPLYLISRR